MAYGKKSGNSGVQARLNSELKKHYGHDPRSGKSKGTAGGSKK